MRSLHRFQLLLCSPRSPSRSLARFDHRPPARSRLRRHRPDRRRPRPQPARQVRRRRLRRPDRDKGRDRIPDRRLPLIRPVKEWAKRHWPVLSLRTILFGTLLFVATLPGFAAMFLRVYENTLSSNEAELIAEGSVLAAAFKPCGRRRARSAPRQLAPGRLDRPSHHGHIPPQKPKPSPPCRPNPPPAGRPLLEPENRRRAARYAGATRLPTAAASPAWHRRFGRLRARSRSAPPFSRPHRHAHAHSRDYGPLSARTLAGGVIRFITPAVIDSGR